jgi:hypothetical protein
MDFALQLLQLRSRYQQATGRWCIMWIILILLWLAPVSLALVIAARVRGGLPAVTQDEWTALFRDRREFKLSLAMVLSFTIVAILFFFLGILQGIVLINIGSFWMVLVPLLTGFLALVLVLLWLRLGGRDSRIGRSFRAGVHHRRLRDMLPR